MDCLKPGCEGVAVETNDAHGGFCEACRQAMQTPQKVTEEQRDRWDAELRHGNVERFL